MKNQITLDEFLEEVGRQRFQNAIGRSTQLLTRAVAEGVMPSAWFVDVRDWCVANKIDVPEHLFKWSKRRKSASHDTQNAYDGDGLQGAG